MDEAKVWRASYDTSAETSHWSFASPGQNSRQLDDLQRLGHRRSGGQKIRRS